MHFGSPPYVADVRERGCDGSVIGGAKCAVMGQGRLSAEAELSFCLQIAGNGPTTTWAGNRWRHAMWPAITCLNLYSHPLLNKPMGIVDGCHKVPATPGLGVEVDEAAVEKYRFRTKSLMRKVSTSIWSRRLSRWWSIRRTIVFTWPPTASVISTASRTRLGGPGAGRRRGKVHA